MGVLLAPVYGQIIPSNANIAYLFTPKAHLHLAHKIYTKGNQKMVLLEVTTNVKTSLDSLVFSYAYAASLNEPIAKFNVIPINKFQAYAGTNRRVYAFPVGNDANVFLIFRIFITGESTGFTYIVDTSKYISFFASLSGLTEPILSGYAHKNSRVKLARLYPDTTAIEALFFSQKFKPALPPMATLKIPSPFGTPDSTIKITATPSDLSTSTIGTYALFNEQVPNQFSLFRITSTAYPKINTIDGLIEASIYLLTKEEHERLATTATPKKEYDAFWLDNCGTSKRAGRMISAYFKRVKQANSMFTSFKEGWKTDMGMIYIIFGPPDKVVLNDTGLHWQYNKTYELPTMKFDFYIQNTQLVDSYYVLLREGKHRANWFRAIDLWRKGRKNL